MQFGRCLLKYVTKAYVSRKCSCSSVASVISSILEKRWNNTPINWKLEGEENNEQFIIEPVGQVTLAHQSQENLYNIQVRFCGGGYLSPTLPWERSHHSLGYSGPRIIKGGLTIDDGAVSDTHLHANVSTVNWGHGHHPAD